MCTSSPDLANQQGSTLSDADKNTLFGTSAGPWEASEGLNKSNPNQFMQMFMNWLTVGGKPKPIEPGQIFKEQQDVAGVVTRGEAGAGIGGLFGAGLVVGDLVPKVSSVLPTDPLNQLNKSPMQPGVPYSTTPLVKVGG